MQYNLVVSELECLGNVVNDELQDKNVCIQGFQPNFCIRNDGIGDASQQGFVSECLYEIEVECTSFMTNMDMIVFNKEYVKETCLAKNEKCLSCRKSYISEQENLSNDGAFKYPTCYHINLEF